MMDKIESETMMRDVLQGDKLIIIDFFATWCVPCSMMSEVLHEIEKNYGEKLEIFKVDVDEQQELAISYGVNSMPTLVFFKNGAEIERKIGYMEYNELEEIVKKFV